MEKTAIVTGAGRGIGAAIARRLASDGCRVAVLDLEPDGAETVAATIREAGGHAVSLGVDVADEAAVKDAVVQVADTLGPPNVLVNNAGITRDNLLFKMDIADWRAVMDVHLQGAFLMTRAAQAHMVEGGWGRVVNLSSTSALGKRGQTNYAAAKAGVQGFTKALALELGRYGVTANAVAPGFIETEMTEATATRLGISFDQLKQESAAAAAVGRTGTPDDVAHTVSYLASEGAGYVSGQVIYVAGGPRG